MNKQHFPTVDKWFQHWEVWVTGGLIILTLLLGLFGTPVFSQVTSDILVAIVIAFLEFIIGVAIFIVRRISGELERFQTETATQILDLRRALFEHSDLARHMLSLNDPQILASTLKIASTLMEAAANPLLYDILKSDLERKASEFAQIVSAEDFAMWKKGDYTPIQHQLQNYMEALTEGCSYLTISNLKFWSGHEISHPSDFLRFNVDRAEKRGVSFQRVFLLNKKFADLLPLEVDMFIQHHLATRRSKGKIKTFVIEADEHHVDDIKEYGNFSIWLSNDSKPRLLLKMVYNDKTGDFERLEASKEWQRVNVYYQRFNHLLAGAQTIEAFLRRYNAI